MKRLTGQRVTGISHEGKFGAAEPESPIFLSTAVTFI